ncbi:spermidine synthase [Streptomyces sp. NPDC001339]|uniref:spermidine synthase n=1 Tax=Streptomyces sp. NPDC001339 TaxID=3364563 RepID=UPI0036B79A02
MDQAPNPTPNTGTPNSRIPVTPSRMPAAGPEEAGAAVGDRDRGSAGAEPIPVTRAVDSGTAKLLPDLDRRWAWLLTVDGAPQSYVDLDAPTHLEFEYVQRLAHVLDEMTSPDQPLDVLHLGGGALTLPRYLAATRPRSRQTVIEADRGLLALVAEQLPLPGDCGITVRAQDARTALEGAPAGSVDVILADVFGGARVPAHLTSVEYARAAARVLRADGWYAANLADSAPFGFLRHQLANFATVFEHLALIAEPSVLRGRRFGNAVLLASRTELPVAELARRAAGDAFPARVEHGAALRRLVGDAEPVRDADAVASPEPPEGAFSVG